MRKIVFFLFLFLSSYNFLQAQNPIVPAGMYMSDPSAHAWKDGRLYVYGSRDESCDYYCSKSYDVLSTTDLKTWTITKNSFSSVGANDQVSYSDNLLYAPDAQYKDGIYYLYYCLAEAENVEGVATSTNPNGPFLKGKNIKLRGLNQIDPAVFMDDDGQAYYIWGQFAAKMAKLNPDMETIDESSIKDSVVTEKEHFFHEGGYMIKHNGIYYFIYAHMGRAGMPTCIGYSTSRHPMGPFKYGGVIIDNDHCDPGNWNNHGCLVEFHNHWYVFYHRSTNGCNTMRKACLEPIAFNKDGSINEVEMTSQGAGLPLNAKEKIDAERACLLYGNVRIQPFEPVNEQLGGIRNNDKAAYKYIDFEKGLDSVVINVAPGEKPGVIDIALDDSWGPSIASVKIPGNGDGKIWMVFKAAIKKTNGLHAVWLRFTTEGVNTFNVDWFKFK
ncbi:MAG: family 43 glycosylhydrolase [Bacteroidota bacterium]|nr:family 43 glycosylhydrolase [Bacteroidota bacterium]